MSKNWTDITLSLAGVLQACVLVNQVANTGQLPEEALKTSIKSVLDLAPSSTLDVYGGDVSNLRVGLEALRDILDSANKAHPEATRYALGVLILQKKLMARDDMLGLITTRLQQVNTQVTHFSETHENVMGNIADLYSETLSKFTYRIQVTGNYNHLQQTRIANQIRALLFSAVRSAILWRQNGGSRLHFLLNRKQIGQALDQLLSQLSV